MKGLKWISIYNSTDIGAIRYETSLSNTADHLQFCEIPCKAIICLGYKFKILPIFPHFSTDIFTVQYRIWPQKLTEWWWVAWTKSSPLSTLLYFRPNRIPMCTFRSVVLFVCNSFWELWTSYCWAFVIFVKRRLGHQQLHSNEEVEVAGCKWLWMQEPGLCHGRHSELVARWNQCIIHSFISYSIDLIQMWKLVMYIFSIINKSSAHWA